MIIQSVIFKSDLSEDEIRGVMEERMPQFQALPGLIQKYYVANRETEEWAGFYIWDSPESMKEYRDSDLAKSIPQAYKVSGAPNVQVYEVITPLRE